MKSGSGSIKWVVIAVIAALIVGVLSLYSYAGARKCLGCGRTFSSSVREFSGTGYCTDCSNGIAGMQGKMIVRIDDQFSLVDTGD